MTKILGIILKESIIHSHMNGKYLIHFPLQVDRTVYIYGELIVSFLSSEKILLQVGDKVNIMGNINFKSGCFMNAKSIVKLPT